MDHRGHGKRSIIYCAFREDFQFLFYVFPIVSLWELSVAIENQSSDPTLPKPNSTFIPFRYNFISTGPTPLEIFIFESINGHMDGRTHRRMGTQMQIFGAGYNIIPHIFLVAGYKNTQMYTSLFAQWLF